MYWRPILISLMVGGLVLTDPIKVRAYFVNKTTSSLLIINAGDWQPPALSFWLKKVGQDVYPLVEVIHNLDFINDLADWQTEGDVSRQTAEAAGTVQTWARLTSPAEMSQTIGLSQSLVSADQPRWLAFSYRANSDSILCGVDFVPVQLYFDEKLIWYLPYMPCQSPSDQWQTALVSLPQSNGELSFRVKVNKNINFIFDITRITSLAVGLTSQDEIELKANETTDLISPHILNYTQDGYQISNYQVQDLAGKVSPDYRLNTLWQSSSPQLSQTSIIYRDSSDKLSLLLAFDQSECINVTFNQKILSAPVVPWLKWTDQNQTVCGQTPALPMALTTIDENSQLKMLLTNTSGLSTEQLIPLPSPAN